MNVPSRRIENIINTFASRYGLTPSGLAKKISMMVLLLCTSFIIASIPKLIADEAPYDYRVALFIILVLDVFDNEDITKFLLSTIIVLMSTAFIISLFAVFDFVLWYKSENLNLVNFIFPSNVSCFLMFNAIRKAARSFEQADRKVIDQGKLPQERWWIFKYMIFISAIPLAALLLFTLYYVVFCKIEAQACVLGFIMILLYTAMLSVGLAMACTPRSPVRSVKKSKFMWKSLQAERG